MGQLIRFGRLSPDEAEFEDGNDAGNGDADFRHTLGFTVDWDQEEKPDRAARMTKKRYCPRFGL